MAATELARLSASTTTEICADFELGDEAGRLIDEDRLDLQLPPGAFLDALLENGLVADALRFLAYALPKREAVWWSCRCIRSLVGEDTSLPGLCAAESWVNSPSESNRRTAMAAAEELDFGTPDAWAAAGAFWAEGSMAPAAAPELPAGKELTGHAVAGAVLLAAAAHEPDAVEGIQRQFAALAVETTNRTDPWEAAER